MQAYMETIFDAGYLVSVLTLGLLMMSKAKAWNQQRLFGLTAVVLGAGDAFHLVPRMIGLLTGSMGELTFWLGLGKLITSITMTLFYVLLYHFLCLRCQKHRSSALTTSIYIPAVCRIALCLLPQNAWFSADAPLRWGILRNIPFVLLGAMLVFLLQRYMKTDRYFRFAWLAVLLSFLFYIPVVLWADKFPLIGMLMLPKTPCYLWLVTMGWRAFKQSKAL